MTQVQKTISPIDGEVVVERPLASTSELETALAAAEAAQRGWAHTPLDRRRDLASAFVDRVMGKKTEIGAELTLQMGRPTRYTDGELAGFEQRARTMIDLAPDALADLTLPKRPGFSRFIRREPLGLVMVLAPWNYPWLTAVNAIVPALVAGNVVLLKHSDQTPLVAERMTTAAEEAGIPAGVFQHLHMSHDLVADAVRDRRVGFVAFTGSVEGGRAVQRAAADRFVGVGLELGGKDPAYVCADAPFEFSVENLVDAAFFNSGQSCCAVERIYVHASKFQDFVDAFVAMTRGHVLGDPRHEDTTLGPVVRVRNAESIQKQVDAAIAAGARSLLTPAAFPGSERGLPYLPPQVLVDVDDTMALMREETFGPVVGIAPVADDDEAVRRMNDSPYGLTASVWTSDEAHAISLAERLETGTCFMNRADYLDPELAWVGVKDSGRGCTLSRVGYEYLTRPKSFHLRHAP